jgi:hypothetical protein
MGVENQNRRKYIYITSEELLYIYERKITLDEGYS